MASEIDKNVENILIIASNVERYISLGFMSAIEEKFSEKYNIYIGSPLGGVIQIMDKYGEKVNDDVAERKSIPFDLLDPYKFKAMVVPSMYGSLIDLSNNERLGYIINEMNKINRVLCFIGFGVAAMLSVRNNDNTWPFEGYTLTGPTLFEELTAKTPENSAPALYMETILRSNGAEFTSFNEVQPPKFHVVVCCNIITAQNEFSANLALENTRILIDY